MNQTLEKPPAPPWPGLHLTRLANDQAKPVLQLIVNLDAHAAVTSWRFDRMPGAEGMDAAAAGMAAYYVAIDSMPAAKAPDIAALIAGGGREPQPSIDKLRFLVAAAEELVHLVMHAGTIRNTSAEWKLGYRTALADLQGSEELRNLHERAEEMGRLLAMPRPAEGGGL